ncbi:MAG: DUF3536 domain-containing protein [Desulfobacterales bacterium]
MNRYICIHGHFYQPPRENAWLEEVEVQDSAYPYHDWNERISAECYAANAASRILNDSGNIVDIVNNYSRISFNFGPTLLSWLEYHAPSVYRKILEADLESRERFSGHGSALAQAFNHMIMPLASDNDKTTQILWGIADFKHRFGRLPEGMWLPETAVDLATLDLMADYGIAFTILSPFQAHQVKKEDADDWEDVSGGRIDPTTAYKVALPSGREFSLFFYDGAISRAVAFEGILGKGEWFAERLMSGFSEEREDSQMLHIATDGESYGHHHYHGDMALAYALHYIESQKLAQLTNYGEFLEKHPPVHEVEIFENSSWSCPHGVDRWRADCGCSSGGHPGWNQSWRKPLRDALDWLRDTLTPIYEHRIERNLKNAWAARNDYIDIILNRTPETIDAFMRKHAACEMTEADTRHALKLLELQRHAMLMYTSCGWFFDELSGIETVQVIQYAGRVIQIAKDMVTKELEAGFLRLMQKVPSNIPEYKNGRYIYEKFVKPAMVDLKTVCAHYAISSLFYENPGSEKLFCYTVDQESYTKAEVGNTKLALGRAVICSDTTLEHDRFCFGVLHWGDHNISGCVRICLPDEPKEEDTHRLFETFNLAAFPETLQLLEKMLDVSGYSLRTLFRDQQRRITGQILSATLETTEGIYRQIYEANAPLLRFLKDAGMPAPKSLLAAAEYISNLDLKTMIEQEGVDPERIHQAVEEAYLSGISLDAPTLEMAIRRRLEDMSIHLYGAPDDLEQLQELDALLTILSYFPFETNLRRVQNTVYDLLTRVYPEVKQKPETDEKNRTWIELFQSVCRKLAIEIPDET